MDKVGEPIAIPFGTNRAALNKAGKDAAAKLADVLASYPLYGAVLTAGAARGEKTPARLAKRRAAAVAKRLTGRGGVRDEQLFVAVKRQGRREVSARIVERPLEGL
jgi:outer membrane protein OmpA-like peptidoglycan-associated protein